jgi:predicted phage gp36 major capsid-like protein
MFGEPSQEVSITAVEVGGHLAQLEAERALALSTGVADIASYMADLDEEIEVWRQLYVTSAVTEIATLRGELSGRNFG